MVKGEKVCTESEYLWTNIPEAYAGIKFAQPKHKHAATTTFTVKNDGLAYVAFSAKTADEDDNKNDDIISRRDIERMGWKAVDEKFNLLSDDGAYIVFAKQCTAGESFALKTHKYCAPIVLIK